MPLQNRVTPFGDIVAVPERGMFTGNRGVIHDPATRTLLTRRWAGKAWLVCRCDIQGVRRAVMARQSWTELFFLDEATALAAGHRPCFFCRREAAERFRACWPGSRDGTRPSAAAIDAVLHRERLDGRAKRLHDMPCAWDALPDGAMLAAGGQALMVRNGQALAWSAAGYREARPPAAIDGMLTPPSTLAVLRAGYRPALHASSCQPPSAMS